MSSLYTFTQEEVDAVQAKFPKLKLEKQGVWRGVLDFFAEYEGYQIRGSYKICIITPYTYPSQLPFLIEIGGRTQAIAKKYGITDLRQLHCNPRLHNMACLCAKQEEKIKFPPGSNLVVFINELVIPYLFGLSYFDKHGKWAPWGEYSHGGLGVLECHAEYSGEITKQDIEEVTRILRADENWKECSKQLRKPSGERFCICSSRKPFKKCHKKAWEGLQRLHSDIQKYGLNVRKLFQI
jgi:hypothetical protein